MRRLIATTAVLCALWLPGAAHADLGLVAVTQPSSGYTLSGLDSSSEVNGLTITQDPATQAWLITDTAGISAFPGECTRLSATQINCAAAPFNIITFDLGAGVDVAQATGPYHALGPQEKGLVDILVVLGNGNDRFTGGGGSNAAIGGPGRDRLVGGSTIDNLIGGAGRDKLFGMGGRDFLVGGKSNDSLFGGPGIPDLMLGGKGKDNCVGQGRDRVASCEKVRVVR